MEYKEAIEWLEQHYAEVLFTEDNLVEITWTEHTDYLVEGGSFLTAVRAAMKKEGELNDLV